MSTHYLEASSRSKGLRTAIALLLLAAAASHAGPFDQEARDFVFCFSVSGYDEETWLTKPSALALNERAGLMYVADSKAESVAVFSLQGAPKSQSGSKGEVKAPIGLAVDKVGSLYVSENEGGPIKILNPKGEVSTLELPTGEGPAKPGRMTFDRDGNLYVVERTACRIYVFDKERKLKFKLGGKGDKRGEFKVLQDVAVDRQGRIYALDSAGVPIQVFDKKGKYIYRFGFRGDGEEDIALAAGLFVDQNDQIWVVDRGRHCLKVFDRSGTFLRRFGSYGLADGSFCQPIDADSDRFGRIYVLEAGARRLQVFSLSRPFEPLTPTGL
ncbi:MAG TPA: 6-bladed beta-propeller [Armatimonadota bacterium]|nr:6-bladed beta-propeller [Armatimonadota bacterium]